MIWLLVAVGAGVSTLVASVMAEEQNQRLKNGALGTVATSFAGALMALLTDDKTLVIAGFFGSSIGAVAGWLLSIVLSFSAAKWPWGRTLLEYQIGGWQAVRDRLSIEEREPLYKAYKTWGQNFVRFIRTQEKDLQGLGPSAARDAAAEILLRGWLLSIVEIVDLLFQLGKRPNYRSRVTIIVFGKDASGAIKGKHWLSDSGTLPGHKKGREFNEGSIGYQVLTEQKPSPFFTTGDSAKKEGQDRGEQAYRPFVTFRISNDAIVAVDWPASMDANDPYIGATQELFHQDVVPTIASVLAGWSGPLQSRVGLSRL